MFPSTRHLLALSLALFGSAHAADISFSSNPFAGANAKPNDGVRTVFAGNQTSLPGFDQGLDRFLFDASFFSVGNTLNVVNSSAANLPTSGVNLIVIQDTAVGFNAGTAANLIAGAIDQDSAGFFVHHNRGLGVNRRVYSTNLNLNTADLSVLARIESPSGPAALDALPGFSASHFAVAAVPEPASWALLGAGLAPWQQPRAAARPAEATGGRLEPRRPLSVSASAASPLVGSPRARLSSTRRDRSARRSRAQLGDRGRSSWLAASPSGAARELGGCRPRLPNLGSLPNAREAWRVWQQCDAQRLHPGLAAVSVNQPAHAGQHVSTLGCWIVHRKRLDLARQGSGSLRMEEMP